MHLLLFVITCVCCWLAADGAGTSSGRRPVSDPLTSPPVMDPSTAPLQALLETLQRQVATMSNDVAFIRREVVKSSSNTRQLFDYFLKTSCSEVVAADVAVMVADTASGATTFTRQDSADGVFSIVPPNGRLKRVRCDHTRSGELGWTVVLHRMDGSVDFKRSYKEYEMGFGEPSKEVWIGLETLHALTSAEPHQLMVEMTDFGGRLGYALYRNFKVHNASTHYQLEVSGYDRASTAGDPLKDHTGMKFSTLDSDQDLKDVSCANMFGGGGGWWYATCYHALGTGQYRRPSHTSTRVAVEYGGITWYPFLDVKQSLANFKMLMKPLD